MKGVWVIKARELGGVEYDWMNMKQKDPERVLGGTSSRSAPHLILLVIYSYL